MIVLSLQFIVKQQSNQAVGIIPGRIQAVQSSGTIRDNASVIPVKFPSGVKLLRSEIFAAQT